MKNAEASYKSGAPDRYLLLRAFARENRANATDAEQYLWMHLRRHECGEDFLRQHIIGDYIVDFVSRHGGLVVEVDGGYHSEPRQQEDDVMREDALREMGYNVMRFTNEKVLFDIDNVLQQIKDYFE